MGLATTVLTLAVQAIRRGIEVCGQHGVTAVWMEWSWAERTDRNVWNIYNAKQNPKRLLKALTAQLWETWTHTPKTKGWYIHLSFSWDSSQWSSSAALNCAKRAKLQPVPKAGEVIHDPETYKEEAVSAVCVTKCLDWLVWVCVCVCVREPQTYVPSCLMYDFQLSLNSWRSSDWSRDKENKIKIWQPPAQSWDERRDFCFKNQSSRAEGLLVPADCANIQERCSHGGSLSCLPPRILFNLLMVSLRQELPQELGGISADRRPFAGGVQTIARAR